MVVFSFDKRRGLKTAALIIMSVLLIGLCAVISFARKEPAAEYATADEIGRYSTAAYDSEARRKFLKQFKIEVEASSEKADKIIIPKSFDEVYCGYNKLQKAVGLNLEPFSGEEAQHAVYKIKDSEKYVTLLIYEGRVIGGHLSTGVYGDAYEALNGEIG